MIALSYITSSLNELDKLYNEATSKKKAIYYSKLATLELCGWVEDTLDDIVLMHANRKLKKKSNRKYIRKEIVKRTNGFQYEFHIRPMLISVIGLITLERIERKFEKTGKISTLKNSLSNLRESRNKAAHTHLKGAMSNYDAPSVIRGEFQKIKTVLLELDSELRAM
jgi:hypothetical protein